MSQEKGTSLQSCENALQINIYIYIYIYIKDVNNTIESETD